MLESMKSPVGTGIPILLFFCAVLFLPCASWSQKRQFQFEQFPAVVYQGPVHIPTGLHKDEKGAWRDALEKWVDEPEVTFAGEYYLAGHSCGTFCRDYQLFDLRTGKDIQGVDRFTCAEEPPKSPDGHPYLTILYSKPGSRLLIAEYHLDFDNPNKQETCRQQYFVLKSGKLQAISKTFSFCTEDHDGRQ
jgi:hypothetical protein